ncbi:unnamed protein product [Ilex paraguariensis]|uniref:F-box domain-containing protein n=1 Tax=Ilex paraguariensis TaxID=185542 RepID=A0ABC8RTN8_9AQUA
MSSELSNLPRDVIFDILSRLPTKSLLQFRCVSKSYPPIISHPHFINFHLSNGGGGDHHVLLHYESTDYTTEYYSIRCTSTFYETIKLEIPFKSVNGYFRIVGSSKGIICLFDTNYFTYIGTLIFWNPSIRKFKIVKDSHLSHRFRDKFSHMVVGFGLVSKINDFKVVQILYDLDNQAEPDVLVYGFDDDCWRKIEAVAPCFVNKGWSNNVFVNGCVHWMAYERSKKLDGRYNSIMAFDVGDEVFRVMELPRNREINYDQMFLFPSASEESLSLFILFRDGASDRWEMWIMRQYGMAESWMRQFTIVQLQISLPLMIRNNGEVLLVMNNGNLVSYDPENQQVKDLGICGLPSSFRIVSYMPSLALLDGGERAV